MAPKNCRLQAAVLAVLANTAAVVAGAQPMALDTPADSPLWWTLTEEISPADLRGTYLDPADNLQRFEDAVQAGLAQPVPTEQLSQLRFAANGYLNPELTPMWLAYRAVGDRFFRLLPGEARTSAEAAASRQQASLAMQAELAHFAVSQTGARQIATETRGSAVSRRTVTAEIAAESLTALRDGLSSDDWEGFRRYLLERVAVDDLLGPPAFETF